VPAESRSTATRSVPTPSARTRSSRTPRSSSSGATAIPAGPRRTRCHLHLPVEHDTTSTVTTVTITSPSSERRSHRRGLNRRQREPTAAKMAVYVYGNLLATVANTPTSTARNLTVCCGSQTITVDARVLRTARGQEPSRCRNSYVAKTARRARTPAHRLKRRTHRRHCCQSSPASARRAPSAGAATSGCVARSAPWPTAPATCTPGRKAATPPRATAATSTLARYAPSVPPGAASSGNAGSAALHMTRPATAPCNSMSW
jgi:hypothetical protein